MKEILNMKQVINELNQKLNSNIEVINIIRCQVGEGLEQSKDQLADEVAKLL